MNIFERNSKKTIVAVWCLTFAVLLAVFESLSLYPEDPLLTGVRETAASTDNSQVQQIGERKGNPVKAPEPALLRRVIRLKEHLPGQRLEITPTAEYLEATDSLEDRTFKFEVDANGFIEPSEIHEKPDFKIVFLGGSTTETLYVDPEKRFPYLVGRQLENHLGLRVNTYNSGVSGNHSMHSNLILLAKILPMEPDIIVLMEAGNDLAIMRHLGGYWNQHLQRSIIIAEKAKTDFVVALTPLRAFKTLIYATFPNSYTTLKRAKDRLVQVVFSATTHETGPERESNTIKAADKNGKGKELSEETKALVQDEFAATRGKIKLNEARATQSFRRSLKTFVGVTRLWGAMPVLMTQANRMINNPDKFIRENVERYNKSSGMSYDTLRRQYDRFNEIIREVAAEEGVTLVDLHRAVPPSREYMYDLQHFNNEGSKFAAITISDALASVVEKINRDRQKPLH